MPEGFLRHSLFTEPLHGAFQCTGAWKENDRHLTPSLFCKSSFEYVFMASTATPRPRYSPFHVSANTLLYNATPGSVITNGDHQGSRENFVAVTRPIQSFETFLSGSRRKVGTVQRLVGGTYLVYHIDGGLRAISKEAKDHINLILTGEYCLG